MSDDNKIHPSEITPEELYKSRRTFLKTAIWAGTGLATGAVFRSFSPKKQEIVAGPAIETHSEITSLPTLDALEKPNTLNEIGGYNNYYEFSTDKSAVADRAKNFVTRPWAVEVGGIVHSPKTFGIDELLKFEQVERTYRFRCVEGWSMVIPWVGFPLSRLLKAVEPLGSATHVAFETYYDAAQMPDAKLSGIELPYVEGLRLDEAMHPLTLLATGIYGKSLPNQNGAPIRLVVPWKYGFKSCKSIVKITLTDHEPPTTWNLANAGEYGFYSNVNPSVDHPRWSQAHERRIGEQSVRPTLMFNGYGDQVASLYAGMDLRKFY